MPHPAIFCPTCSSYLGSRRDCRCGWTRPQALPEPGRPLWSAAAPRPVLALAVADLPQAGPLLLASLGARGEAGGGLLALDPSSGEQRWLHQTPAAVEGGAARAGSLFLCGDEEGHLYALDPAGRPAWNSNLEGAVRAAAAVDPADQVQAYFATTNGMLACLDARTGRPVWRTRRSGDSPRFSTPPVLTPRHVLVGTLAAPWEGGELLAFERGSGKLAWRRDCAAGIRAAPLCAAGTIYLALTDGTLLALDEQAAEVRWRFQTQAAKAIVAAPLLAAGILYLGAQDHFLYALDAATGQERWSYDGGASLITTPVLLQGLLFVGDNRGRLWAVEAARGRLLARFDLPAAPGPLAGPAGHQDVVYVAAAAGQIVSLPAHLGQYAQLGDWAEADGRPAEAAAWRALAGQDEAAAALFAQAHDHERAALVYEAVPGGLTRAAQAWERAAGTSSHPAFRWQRAAAIWDQLRDAARAEGCRLEAARARGSPYLVVELIGGDPLKVGHVGRLRLRVVNRAEAPACDVVVQVLSKDIRPCPPEKRPELDHNVAWELSLCDLEPLRAGTLTLELLVRYADRHGNSWESRWEQIAQVAAADQPPIQVERFFAGPAQIVQVGGDAGLIRMGEPAAGGAAAAAAEVQVQGGIGVLEQRGGQVQAGGDVLRAHVEKGQLQVDGDVGSLEVDTM